MSISTELSIHGRGVTTGATIRAKVIEGSANGAFPIIVSIQTYDTVGDKHTTTMFPTDRQAEQIADKLDDYLVAIGRRGGEDCARCGHTNVGLQSVALCKQCRSDSNCEDV